MKNEIEEKNAVELEECAKTGKKIPEDCKLFRIRIDREKYLVQQAGLTGRELLNLTGMAPALYRILYKECGGKAIEIPLETYFSFLTPRVERFMTQKRTALEG